MASKDEKDGRDRRREQDLHDYWKVQPYWAGEQQIEPSRSSLLGSRRLP
jgi:hypothetical protein